MSVWVQGWPRGQPRGCGDDLRVGPANCDERPIGEFLVFSGGHDAYLADKGFSSVAWERHWSEEYGALVAATPQESAKRAWPEAGRRWAASKRQLIEGVISQLKEHFGLERHRAKTLNGLLTRLAAKVAAYTCGQILNAQLG
ncbi:MAG: transposase [Actinomycetota bacterium]|nr:transposase [Actinomycetota bacterium]